GVIDSTDNIGGLVVDQVHFTAGGNLIRGTTTLGISGSVLFDNVVSDTGANTFDSSLPINLPGGDLFFFIPAGSVDVNGNISGSPAVALGTGSAAGTLTFAGVNNTYTGGTTVADGTMRLNSPGLNAAVGTGPVFVGNSSGAADTAVLRLVQGGEIDNN